LSTLTTFEGCEGWEGDAIELPTISQLIYFGTGDGWTRKLGREKDDA